MIVALAAIVGVAADRRALDACRPRRPGRHSEPGARRLARRAADPRRPTAASPTPTPPFTTCSRNRRAGRSTRLAAAVADPEAGVDFERLRSQAVAGARAIAAVPLRDARGARGRLVQRRGQPDRRPARLQLLAHPGHHRAPRDGGGDPRRAQQARRIPRRGADRLLFGRRRRPVSVRQPDLGEMARRAPRPRWSAATSGCTISSPSPPPPGAAPSDPFGGRADDAQRGEVVLREPRRPHHPCLDRPERRRRRRRAAHPLGRPRPDARARMGGGAAPVARALPAVFRQRAGRHRADRPLRPAGGGEPRARRTVRRAAAGPDRRAADRLRQRGRPPRARGQARRRGRGYGAAGPGRGPPQGAARQDQRRVPRPARRQSRAATAA